MLVLYILLPIIFGIVDAVQSENVILEDCCEFAVNSGGDSKLLLECILKSQRITQPKIVNELKIGITTYYDENIEDYAAYSLAINAAYVSERGYGFVIHSPQTQSNFEPRDARWNR